MSALSNWFQHEEGEVALALINDVVVPNEAAIEALMPQASVAVSDLLAVAQAAAAKKSAFLGSLFADGIAMYGAQITAEVQKLAGEGEATLPMLVAAAQAVAQALIAK